MIRRVEDLHSELQCLTFRKIESLRERSIDADDSGANESIAPEIASLIQRTQFKRVDIPIAIRTTKNRIVRCARFQVWSFVEREVRRVEVTRPVVSRNLHCKRRPAVHRRDVVQLPSSE